MLGSSILLSRDGAEQGESYVIIFVDLWYDEVRFRSQSGPFMNLQKNTHRFSDGEGRRGHQLEETGAAGRTPYLSGHH